MNHAKIVLASQSSIRAKLLVNAGLKIETMTAPVDEGALKDGYENQNDFEALAIYLAQMKAESARNHHPDAYIIGADQMMVCDGKRFDKPADMDEAKSQLEYLRGRVQTLLTAAVILTPDGAAKTLITKPQIFMRDFTDDFISHYLAQEGSHILESVGACKLEEYGVQLVEKIEGDYFSILGLPLLEMLAYFREENVVKA